MRPTRLGLLGLALLLLLPVPAHPVLADEAPAGEPSPVEKRVAKMTQAERNEALKQAEEMNRRVIRLWRAGQYREAESLGRETLALRTSLLGAEHPLVAQSLLTLGAPLSDQGRYEEARSLCERALEIHEQAYGPNHTEVAKSLHNLAMLLMKQGLYEEARPLFERSLEILERVLSPNSRSVATSLSSLGGLLQAQGLYEEARPLFERSLRISEKVLGPNHPDVALGLHNLATLLERQGLYEEAIPLFERSLGIWKRVLGPGHPYVAASLGSFAALLYGQGFYEKARPLYERALEINEKALGPDHPAVAESLSNLARLLDVQGFHAEARPLLERSLEIREGSLGPDHPSVAISLGNLASLFHRQGRHEKARPLYERAIEVKKTALGPDHPSVATSLNNLARLLVDLDEYELASQLFAECLDIVEASVRHCFAGLHAPQRRGFLAAMRRYLDCWLRYAPTVNASGYGEVLRFKGLVARATTAERKLTRQGGSDAAARVTALQAVERRLSKLANSMPSASHNRRHAVWEMAYAVAGAEREQIALTLARDFAPLRQGLERLDLTREDIQSSLRSDAVLVDYLRSEGRYLAWILRAEGQVGRIDLGAADAIEQAAEAFVGAVAEGRGPSRGPLRDEAPDASRMATELGESLRRLVLTPIESMWGEGVDTVYLCPDAALAAVPFGALPGREKGRFLIDDYVIVNVSMAQELVPWSHARKRGEGAVAVGDVDYGAASEDAGHAVVSHLRGVAVVDRAPRGGRFLPLAETRSEVEFIRKWLGEDCDVVCGAQATEARFRAESTGRRILHLATHGFVRDDLMRGLRRRKEAGHVWLGADMERQLAVGHDPMNLAGLAFAGANPRDGGHGDDGILTAAEASYLDLDGVDLVVLSACESALGKVESGEGVIGLVQGFQMAGAKRVIASLWQVDDEATRLLMQHLYDGMLREEDPLSPAEALREAALQVRGSTGQGGRSFAAPTYWASFVAYGK